MNMETPRRKSECNSLCALCGKIYIGEDQMAEVMCCEAADSCGCVHMWCKDCWMRNFSFLSFCPVEKKNKERRFNLEENQGEERKKKPYKYYKKAHVNLMTTICSDLCKKYCIGCFFFGSPSLCHSCLLPDDEKIKKYVRIAICIIHESGLACIELRKILEEKKGKNNFDCEITTILEHRMSYAELNDDIEIMYR